MTPAALKFLQNSKFRLRFNLRQAHKATEYRGGCLYRTRLLGYIICEPDYINSLLTCTVSSSSVPTHITEAINPSVSEMAEGKSKYAQSHDVDVIEIKMSDGRQAFAEFVKKNTL